MALARVRGSGSLINSPGNRDCPGSPPPPTPNKKSYHFKAGCLFQGLG